MSPRFINDLIPLILESDEHWWPRDLVRLCRVSPAWLQPCRKRLYASPTAQSFKAISLLARTLQHSPQIQSLVYGMDIRIERDGSPVAAAQMSSLVYLLGLRLERLVLGGELAVQAERFLNIILHPETIRELWICGSSQECEGCGYIQASLEWDDVTSQKFCNLRQLRVSYLEFSVMSERPPTGCALTDIILDQVDSLDGELTHLFDATRPSPKSLAVTTLVPETYDFVVDNMLPMLSSLQYEVLRPTPNPSTFIFTHVNESLPFLRHMDLNGVAVNPELLTTIARQCPNLNSFSVSGRQVQVEPYEWADFIARKLSCLQKLHIPFGTLFPPFKPWSDEQINQVMDVCLARRLTVL